MDLQEALSNFLHPPVLFFFLGILAVWVKSDLEVPAPIAKFLSLYLLFHIGFNGGIELHHSGFSSTVMKVGLVCIVSSFTIPWLVNPILARKLDVYNAGAISAAYGSVSAVTFATATAVLDYHKVSFGGYMVAGLALMESPAIVSGLLQIRRKVQEGTEGSWKEIWQEALFNGSVFLLMGSMLIGIVSGPQGEEELRPFVDDIFKGMLSLYMLDMGLVAGRRLSQLKQSGRYLSVFALIYSPIAAIIGIAVSYFIGLDKGDALMLTIMISSASYIAVPAAMRLAVPQANMGLLLPMSLGITFTYNVAIGITLYFTIIQMLW